MIWWYKSVKYLVSIFLLKHISGTPCENVKSQALDITRGLFIAESFNVGTLPTVLQCAALCLHFSLCKSINFDQETRTCYLHQHNKHTDPHHDVNAKTSMYYMDYSDISKFLFGGCSDHNCSVHDRCFPITDVDHVCLPYLNSKWACHRWTAVEYASLGAEGHSQTAQIQHCEVVEHHVWYGISPLKPKECGECYCCKLVWVF